MSEVFATATYCDTTGAVRSADTPAARALRALQKYDQHADGRAFDDYTRGLFLDALEALGEACDVRCTGTRDGGHTDHDGDTCPVHEWLVSDDYHDDIPGDVDPAATVESGRADAAGNRAEWDRRHKEGR